MRIRVGFGFFFGRAAEPRYFFFASGKAKLFRTPNGEAEE